MNLDAHFPSRNQLQNVELIRRAVREAGGELVGIQQNFSPAEIVVVFNVEDAKGSQSVAMSPNTPIAEIYDRVKAKISSIPHHEKSIKIPLVNLENFIERLRDVANGLEKFTEKK